MPVEKFDEAERQRLLALAFSAVPRDKGDPQLTTIISKLSGVDTVVYADRAYASRSEAKYLVERLSTGTCPDCNAFDMLVEGPRGGIAVNTACGYCGAEFNVAHWAGQVIDAQRTGTKGEPDLERLARVFGLTKLGF